MSLLSVVVNYHTDDLLEKFLISYDRYVEENDRELIVVDVEGDPEKPYQKRWSAHKHSWRTRPWRTHTENVGFAHAVNSALSTQFTDYAYFDNLAIFNADTEFIDPNCVDSCLDLLDCNEDIAVVGPLQYNGEGRITHAGIFGTNEQPMHRAWLSRDKSAHRYIADCVSVSGSAYFVKRSVWDEMTACPLYQEAAPGATGAFLPTRLYHEETFCSYHVREHGYRVMYNGEAEMIHHHDASPNPEKDIKIKESKEQFVAACQVHGMSHN